MIKLNLPVQDTANGDIGTLTHFQVEVGLARYYHFQPKGLSPETGEPVKGRWIPEGRVSGGKVVDDPAELDLTLLGKAAKDKVTDFEGSITALTIHINGCLHAQIQPKGSQKNGDYIPPHDFDIRRLVGKGIPVLSDEEQEKSQKKRPSPAPTVARNFSRVS